MFWADLHVHGRHSIGASRACGVEALAHWAGVKGLDLVGTGDCTHPGWLRELKAGLVEAGDGVYRMEGNPGGARFLVTGEVCCHFALAGKARRVHCLLLLPGFEAAETLARRLAPFARLEADGRPALRLACRDLLEICLEVGAVLVPAHVWTPTFSLFGAGNGFSSVAECFGDLAGAVSALETGLSADPAMMRRVSALDGYTLLSNSDAHGPSRLGREATGFPGRPSWTAVVGALNARIPLPTLEFYPEEGKYYWDGCRRCGIGVPPERSGVCPGCGRKMRRGVLHRVEDLADRETPIDAGVPFERLVPLAQVLASCLGKRAESPVVQRAHAALIRDAGPELLILRSAEIPQIAAAAGEKAAAAIANLRAGRVRIEPGYDGIYGTVHVL